MVGLAKQLKGEPFHLVASYCQRGPKQAAVDSIRAEGWDETKQKNITVHYASMFPKLGHEIKYVPYYLIFDHTGKLRYHHMAGPYQGGNGNAYQDQVKKLLAEVPE